jgi:hypothetical protein
MSCQSCPFPWGNDQTFRQYQRDSAPTIKFSTVDDIRHLFAYPSTMMFDPTANVPRPNRSLIYFGACLIAGIRLAREKQANVRAIPTGAAIDESVELAHEIFCRVFRKVPGKMEKVIH